MSIEDILIYIQQIEDVFWIYVGVPVIIGFGLYFSIKSNFFQIREMHHVIKIFLSYLKPAKKKSGEKGISPIHAFFVVICGSMGIGNIVGVCTAVELGGPGAVFWMWITALIGMLVKYAEIYLGVKFRIKNEKDCYSGGPIVYLKQFDRFNILSTAVALLLCLYGIEVYMFKTVTHTISVGWGIDQSLVIIIFLIAVLWAGKQGIEFVGKISAILIPIFLVIFMGMSFTVFYIYAAQIPGVFYSIFVHAFTPHAAAGAFIGSSVVLAMSHGMRRACYTGDIGIGYASTVHSASSESDPAKQASMGIVAILLDTFIICTMSVLLILVTGVWQEDISHDQMVVTALSKVFPFVTVVWPFFVFILGYSSIIAFFSVGKTAAWHLSAARGEYLYFIVSTILFIVVGFFGTESHAMAIMSITGILLLILNMIGMWGLMHHIKFSVKDIE